MVIVEKRSGDECASACDMRGFLSFLILWLLSKKAMSGAQLADELEKRKGCRPNPGTIYPALKELARKKAIVMNEKEGKKTYSLTANGRQELDRAVNTFAKIFYDVFTK